MGKKHTGSSGDDASVAGANGSRDLGADRSIPRRDFLQGALIAAAGVATELPLASLAASPLEILGAQDRAGYYPPALTGMRGSHPGSFENAHAVRDGHVTTDAIDTQQSYDLVIVGGGISGLAAAHFYRDRASRSSRILILDNHDDFGGHAKRNEFMLNGRLNLLNGGTLSIESPRPYSPVAAQVLVDCGIDVDRLSKIENHRFYGSLGLHGAVFLDRETFGTEHLMVGWKSSPVAHALAKSGLPEQVQRDIERVEEGNIDYMPGMSSAQKKLRLSSISYRDYLRDLVKVQPLTLAFYQTHTHGLWGAGIDAVSALDCWGSDMPGFSGLKLEPGSIPRMGYTPAGFADTGGSKTLHFPDGNATVARSLLRNLLPGALPGKTVEDLVTTRVKYEELDSPRGPIRVRLNSTVVKVAQKGNAVDVTYIRDGKAYVAHGAKCILACYNMMIPYLCPELPERQKQALHSLVKTPLVYTSVALRNWQAFAKLGVSGVQAPSGYHTDFRLNPKVDIGQYRSPTSPSEPILLHMTRTPCKPGLTEDEQHKVGRAELLNTPFSTFEHNIREQLARVMGPGGFDPARDIEAITVNRWPHGYAPEYNPLFDRELPEAEQPHVIGRAKFGRIAIANSDAARAAYTDAAIDQASRAVNEIIRD
ncbi:MAG: NAD(P)-binding protein [Proteobacteria bacterium]|nr:NAD(P)-binding protein [Pseudomonadota bacterium]